MPLHHRNIMPLYHINIKKFVRKLCYIMEKRCCGVASWRCLPCYLSTVDCISPILILIKRKIHNNSTFLFKMKCKQLFLYLVI